MRDSIPKRWLSRQVVSYSQVAVAIFEDRIPRPNHGTYTLSISVVTREDTTGIDPEANSHTTLKNPRNASRNGRIESAVGEWQADIPLLRVEIQ
jgi:hypothetical protein